MNLTKTHHISSEDRQILFASPGGIGFQWFVMSSLLNGAAAFPFDIKEEGVDKLAEWLIKQKITIQVTM